MTDQLVQPQVQQTASHLIQLIATRVSPSKIAVAGAGGDTLQPGSGQHRFDFELIDQTSAGVRFKQVNNGMLYACDNNASCPPPSGINSTQIIAVTRQSDTRAGFTDKNDNSQRDMPVSYALNFECNDPSVTEPIQFDPIIINGGTNK